MVVSSRGNLQYISFESFDHPGVINAIFTRNGGFSPKPWESLNMGNLIGDDQNRVEKNRILAFRAVNRDPKSIFDVWQIHSSKVVCTDAPRLLKQNYVKGDAIITNNPAVTLFMRFADCVPILLFDPVQKVVGLVHSGWEGTVKKIVSSVVSEMVNKFGCEPINIRTGIGPSISVDQYFIGQDVAQHVRRAFGSDGGRFLQMKNGLVKFDLWKANRYLLEKSGIKEIEVSGICTASNPNDWFSHRYTNGKTGRFGAIIGLSH